jgi:hypothetical protein
MFVYHKDLYLHVHVESPSPLDCTTPARIEEILRQHYNNLDVHLLPPPDMVKDEEALQRLLTRIRDEHDHHWHGREDGTAYLRTLGTVRACSKCGSLICGSHQHQCTPVR